jgi:hypothetical protein
VKVVEGSEIYNFPIHHIVHFYSNFGRKSWSNKGTPSKFLPRACSRARPPPRSYRVPTLPTSASESSAHHSRSPRAFPTQIAPSPRRAHAEVVERCAAVRPPRPDAVRSCPVILAPARAAPPHPAAAPAYKGSAPVGPRTRRFCRPLHAGGRPVRRRPAPADPSSGALAAVPCRPSGASRPPKPPSTNRPLPDRSTTGDKPHRGQPAWAPLAGCPPVFSHPSAASNR